MVEIKIQYEGNLRCRATHESGVELITDAPKDNMGKGESFSPTDLVATALGTCMLTIMGIVAQRDNIDLSGAMVSVKKEMTPPPRRIARLSVEITVPGDIPAEQQQKLKNAAMTCPVHRSILPEVEMPVSFIFSGQAATV